MANQFDFSAPRMTYTEIGKQLGISYGQVQRLEERALKKLRKSALLKDFHGYESAELQNFWDIFKNA
jgi:DNA-directed RNA polymerase sigma subunit (sigma70/sigma32)